MHLTYRWLHDTVRQRFDSDEAMEALLPQPLPAAELARTADDRYLSAMTRRIFQAGMQHAMVDGKWPAFEQAFSGFDPVAMALLGDAELEQFMQDERIFRHRAKLRTIPLNARFILDVRKEQGHSFGAFIADWPEDDIIGLWRLLATRGARLGGRSAAGFLRLVGKDTFLLTSDVVARLVAAGIIAGEPGGQRDLRAVQHAFNELRRESGRSLSQLSALLALSINPES